VQPGQFKFCLISEADVYCPVVDYGSGLLALKLLQILSISSMLWSKIKEVTLKGSVIY